MLGLVLSFSSSVGGYSIARSSICVDWSFDDGGPFFSFPLQNCNIDHKEILFVIDCRHEVREQIDFISQTVDYLRYNRNWTSLNVSYTTSEDKESTSLEVLTANITNKSNEISNQCNGTISLNDLFLRTKQTTTTKHSTLRINFIFLHLMEEDIVHKIYREISVDFFHKVATQLLSELGQFKQVDCDVLVGVWTNFIAKTIIKKIIHIMVIELKKYFVSEIVRKISKDARTFKELSNIFTREIIKMFKSTDYDYKYNDYFLGIATELINGFIRAIARKQRDIFCRSIVKNQNIDDENLRIFLLKYRESFSFEKSIRNLRWSEKKKHRENEYEKLILEKYSICIQKYFADIEDETSEDFGPVRTEEEKNISTILLHYTPSFKDLSISSLYPEICDLKCTGTNLTFFSQKFQKSYYHVEYRDKVSHKVGVAYCKEQFNSYLISIETFGEFNYLMSEISKIHSSILNCSSGFNIHLGLVLRPKDPIFWSSGNPFTFYNELADPNSTQCVYIKYSTEETNSLTFKENTNIWKYLYMTDCEQIVNHTYIVCECHHELRLEEDFINKPMNELYTSGFVFKGDIVTFLKNYVNENNEITNVNCTNYSKYTYERNYYLCKETSTISTFENMIILKKSVDKKFRFHCSDLITIKTARNLSADILQLHCNTNDKCLSKEGRRPLDILNGTCDTYQTLCPKCLKLYDECRDNKHLQNCEHFKCPVDFLKCPDSYCVPMAMVDDASRLCPLGQEKAILKQTESNCLGKITLKLHTICIPDFYTKFLRNKKNVSEHSECGEKCPLGYSCLLYDSQHRTARLHTNRIQLYKISNLLLPNQKTKFSLPYQQVIEISIPGCKIKNVGKGLEHWNTEETVVLDLSDNEISDSEYISSIITMTNLLFLNLSYNVHLSINDKFGFPYSLEAIYLSHTSVTSLPLNCFKNLTRLVMLDLSYTKIHKFKNMGLPDNFQLDILMIEGLTMTEVNVNFFKGLTVKTRLQSSDFKLCCPKILGDNIPTTKCLAPKDAISSCENIVRDRLKRILVWIVGLLTIAGNGIVLFYRVVWNREKIFQTAYGLFVTGLAVSDLLMGVYLMIIAVVDVVYADVYVVYDESWRMSILCHFSGFLSTLSSEISTFLIGLITLDRFISISYPFSAHDTSTSLKWKGFISTWAIGFVLALVPAVVPEWKIYSSNGLCLALPLDTVGFDKPPGWEFSMVVYVILNFFLFLFIALGQVGIFMNVIKTRNLPSMKHCSERRTQDMNIAKKLAFVAVSDFLCWFPIGIMGILSLIGQEFDKETYAWMAVFVLPVNSALNPMIYTIPVIVDKLKCKT
ncbi:hypothetical protein Btru_073670 [Bulinus truncatus]|nr:hypothetical protein Btru_073670 [Bulinus truncatus]